MAIARRDFTAAKLVNLDTTRMQQLLRWRWPIVALTAVTLMTWHTLEHYSEGLLQGMHLLQDVLVFAVLGPLFTGLALTWLARANAERIGAYERLKLKDELSQQLADADSWDELTALIASFPRRVLPVIGTSLFVRDAEADRFDSAVEWRDPDRPSPSNLTRHELPCDCQACTSRPSCPSPTAFQCHRIDRTEQGTPGNRYCLPLKHAGELIGLLYYYLPEGVQPTNQQVHILNALAALMAVALDGARAERAMVHEAAAVSAERERIARDLHDTLGQSLGYLHLKLDQLTGDDTLEGIEAIRDELRRMSQVANESYNQVRGTVAELQASTSAELTTVLQERAQSIAERAGFEVEFLCDGPTRPLRPQVQTHALYVVQEALHNVEKHADAREVALRLSWEENGLSIVCSDDGKGFDPSSLGTNGHFGLEIMRQRAAEIGGDLSIASSPGAGTEVALSIPGAASVSGRNGGGP